MAQRKKKKTRKRQPAKSKKPFYTIGVIALLVVVAAAAFLLSQKPSEEANVVVAKLEGPAGPGQAAFQKHCAECHGNNAAGTDKGPPLVHRYYHPSHHADFSFVRAVRSGVRQHHWGFGNMPPQPEVKKEELDAVIGYVRELQRANGIY